MSSVERVPPAVRAPLHLLGVTLMAAIVGAVSGVGSWALFEALDSATSTRLDHDWLVWLLPVAALALGAVYHYVGAEANRGTSLVITESLVPESADEIERTPRVPMRMAPMIFGATWIAQLTGASVGREGAALQIGGSLTTTLLRPFRLPAHEMRLALIAAMAGAFGGAFGVPFAGAIFALEVQRTGRIRYEALAPALAASITADYVVEGLGRPTPLVALPIDLDAWVALRLVVVGVVAGLAARVFVWSLHAVKHASRRIVSWVPARPVIGAVATLALMGLFGRDYLGLSLPLVDEALAGNTAEWFEPLLKILFTVVALGSGIPGGEVTPLFVVGATLGSALSAPLGLDPTLVAAATLAAVFGAAANTPIACTVLAIELFGGEIAVPAAVVCIVAYAVSSERAIYDGQRRGATKDLRATATPPRRS
jgi:H+/Cl- antiporter ClcA